MKIKQRLTRLILWGFITGSCLAAIAGGALYLYFTPQLPAVEQLRNIQLQTPLRVFSSDRKLIAEFGEKRRTPLSIDEVPKGFIQAILAAEDDRFEEHFGVDLKGLLRAAVQLVGTGRIQSGGSTITMQVAKNYFLTHDRTFSRKFNEILLALQIEQELTKSQILELYVNKIYLGKRAYGIAAAAQVYYGKNIEALDLAQLAMIAALPKAPSSINPLVNPERALIRRNWILQRMQGLGFIDQVAMNEALAQPITAQYHGLTPEVEASYLAEMVRSELLKQYSPSELYTSGLTVYTTIDSRLQNHANQVLRNGLLAYDRRHGYRGAEQSWSLGEAPLLTADGELDPTAAKPILDQLSYIADVGPLRPAVILSVTEQSAIALLPGGELIPLNWDGLKWARQYFSVNAMGPFPKLANEIFKPGDLVRVLKNAESDWQLSQIPEAQSALIAMSPNTGATQSLVGGFSYRHSKFNRVIQATRQPGSNFKPFLYTAALEYGYTAASVINDAPVVFDDELLENSWRPENFSGEFFGPTRLREALYKSRNLVSIRLLRALSIPKAINYIARFGFNTRTLPRDLSLSLGSAELTPMEVVTGYASFANGGYQVEPYFIERIEDADGNTLFQHVPLTVCNTCEDDPSETLNEDEPPAGETANTETAAEADHLASLIDEALDDELNDELNAELDGDLNDELNSELDNGLDDSQASLSENTAAQPVGLTRIEPPELQPKQLPAPRILEQRTAYIIDSILKDVVKRGTARRARSLGRSDIGGKTGTTNDQKDAWFSGYHPDLVTTVWVGFDQPATLGKREVGGYAALPIWIDYMREALKGVPTKPRSQPEGIVSVRIDPATGLLAQPDQDDAIFELFRLEYVPQETAEKERPLELESDTGPDETDIPEQLF